MCEQCTPFNYKTCEDGLVYLMFTVGSFGRGANVALLDVICKYILMYQILCTHYTFNLNKKLCAGAEGPRDTAQI